MGNLITLKRLPPETWVSMNNDSTSVFISIFGLSGTALAKTDHEKLLVVYVLERNQSFFGPGCAGFDIGWMPWDANNLERDRQFILSVIDGMKNKQGWERLGYTPQEEWMGICIDRFESLIESLAAEDVDVEKANEWLGIIEPDDPKRGGFPLCPVHDVLLTVHGCQICTD